MGTPVPYGKSSLDNSPLSSGTQYPCKQRSGVYADEGARAKNSMAVGATQQLTFVGSASHGGGSCQISLTSDKEPTKDSKFAVIKSIEGGCPGGANGGGTATFEYSIPNTVAPGAYTLAWTWFNKVGNREIYMNCAPITVTGGSKKRDVNATNYDSSADSVFGKRDSTFPEMFVANLGDGCKTTDNVDLEFPNPGPVLQKAGSSAPAPPQGTCPGKTSVSLAGGAVSNSGSSPASSGSSPASSGPAPVNSTPSEAPSGTAATPGTATILASPSPNAPAASPISPPLSGTNSTDSSPSGSVPNAAPAAPVAPAAPAAPVAPVAAGSKSCSSPGQMVCSTDGAQFGICQGSSVVMMPVAAGTACKNGAIAFAKAKRNSAKFYAGGWR